MSEYVGKIYIDDSFYQGEETPSEENKYLYQIVSEHTETEYNQQIAQEKHWAILFSLSHIRTNLIQWIPVQKKDKVLQIGADTGALTGILSDLAGEVTVVEASPQSCRILAKRWEERENIKVYNARFQDVEDALDSEYNWILMADSFENAGKHLEGKQAHEKLLKKMGKHLSDQGQVVIACANRLGLKYFAGEQEATGKGYFAGIQGYEEEESAKTFSRPELLALAKRCGYGSAQMYYPYPDAKLPMSIYSDEYLPKVGELWDNRRNFNQERYVLFDETKGFDNVIKDGLFPVFSNAFLVFLSREDKKREQERIIFTKYSNERGRSYAIRTDIIQKSAALRKARKVACYPEGEDHVANLVRWEEELTKVYHDANITMNHCWKSDQGVEMEYLTGQTLEEYLDELQLNERHEEALEELLRYIKTVEKAGSKKPFTVTDRFTEVFGERILPPELLCSDVTDLDMVAGNVIRTGNGFIHMDYEWTFDFPIPVHYVIYRIIQNYLFGNVKRTAMEREWLYKRAGLTDLEIEQYTQMEESFQTYITQKHVPLRLLYDEMSPGCIRFAAEEEKRREEAARNAAANSGIEIFIDSFEIAMTGIYVYGWAVSKAERKVSFRLQDENGKDLEVVKTEYLYRKDVADRFKLSGKNSYAGFRIQCSLPDVEATKNKRFTLICADGLAQSVYQIPVAKLRLKQSKVGKKIMDLRGARDVIEYIAPKDMGLITESDQFRVENQRFDTWQMAHRISTKEEERQKQTRFDYEPKYSLVILSEAGVKGEKRTLEAIKRQTYVNYETISCSRSAITMDDIHGDYVLFLEAGDTLSINALYEFTKALNQKKDLMMLYCDSDQVDYQAKEYYDPQFKPDFAPVTLESGNYIGNSICFARTLLEQTGLFHAKYERQAIYDLILRCLEYTSAVGHISTILYHAENPMERDANQNAHLAREWELGRKVLEDYYRRKNIPANVSWAKVPLRYTVKKSVSGSPLVSIIIPNQDHIEDLEKCLSSIQRKTTYQNIEILVIENNSKLASTFEYYKKMKQNYPKVRLLTWEKAFNYSAINNFAVKEAKGDYYVFLNNDTEVLSCDWIEEMVSVCQQQNVGVVGCRLYYPDGTLQHAGVILGLGSIAGHLFVKEPGTISGYMGKVVLKQNLSAVTAACMMSSREAFEAIGGFDEKLQVALNDVDFCMRCKENGYMIVYDPEVELFHYESKSRGLDVTPEKKARYDGEAALFTERWKEQLKQGDPYYNVNLSRTTWNCTFRIPRS